MLSRTQKQAVIGAVYLLMLAGISYGAYHYFKPSSSCFDNMENGKEEGIDCGIKACGLPCPPALAELKINDEKIIQVGVDDFDFIATIYNPNQEHGASKFDYDLVAKDLEGTEMWRQSGSSFIFADQTKNLIIPRVIIDEGVAVGLVIKSAEWQKVDPNAFPNLTVRRQEFIPGSEDGAIKASVEGLIFNDTDFDFDRVDVAIMVYDQEQNLVAAAKTDIRTFISKTERHFKVFWISELPQEINQVIIEADTNVFDNSNFIKTHGTQERFQKYY